MMLARVSTIVALSAFFSGCTATTDEGNPLDSSDVGDITVVTASISNVVPTVVNVAWQTDQYATGWVEYGLDEDLGSQTPPGAVGKEHSIAMLGLKSANTYYWKAVAELSSGLLVESAVREVAIAPVDSDISRISVSEWVPEKTAGDGYMLFSMLGLGLPSAVVIDREGDIVWVARPEPGLSQFTVKPGLDGKSIAWSQYDDDQITDVGGIVRIAVDGSFKYLTRTLDAHHDFMEHSDGTFSWISYDFAEYPIAGEPWNFVSDEILNAPEQATEDTNPSTAFGYFDDYHRDPWIVCDHTERPDQVGEDDDVHHWTHSNSLMADPLNENNFYLLAKFFDTILKVDRTNGQVLWELGGQNSDFAIDDPSEAWDHGHMSHIWEGGFMMFDNGAHTDPDPTVSRASEYKWDESTMTYEKVWEMLDPDGRYVEFLGDARKLPNGNYLISWTTLGLITEVTPDNEVVWKAELDLGTAVTRITYFEDIYDIVSAPPLVTD
jgi:hypothetical protein